jgi:predicted phage terminase large subunit-like protein
LNEAWEVVSLPAIAIAGREDPLGRFPGELLWPEWYTPEQMEVAQRDTRNWSALYQQEPTPESGDYFKSEWLRWYDSAPPVDTLHTYGASDYAVRANAGDFTVHLVAGVDPADDLYVLDLWREQAASDQWVEALINLMMRWKPLIWAEEKGQIEKGVGPFITKRQLERKVFAQRRQFPSASNKGVRAQAIRGRMAMGKVFLPKRAPWVHAFVDELLRFPAGTHDDCVDALSLLGRLLEVMVPATKPRVVATEAPPLRVEFFEEVERDLLGGNRTVERVRIIMPGVTAPTILVQNVNVAHIVRWPREYSEFKAGAPRASVGLESAASPERPKDSALPRLGAELGNPYEGLRLGEPGQCYAETNAGRIDLWETGRGGRLDPYRKSTRI